MDTHGWPENVVGLKNLIFFSKLKKNSKFPRTMPDPLDSIIFRKNLIFYLVKGSILLRDPKTIKDGFLIFVAGPPIPKVIYIIKHDIC